MPYPGQQPSGPPFGPPAARPVPWSVVSACRAPASPGLLFAPEGDRGPRAAVLVGPVRRAGGCGGGDRAAASPVQPPPDVNDAANSTKTARPRPRSLRARRRPRVGVRVGDAHRDRRGVGIRVGLIDGGRRAQAASNVAGMLASSVTDRTAINDAYNDVYGCGPNLHGDAAVFTRAVEFPARAARQPGDHAGPVGAAAGPAERPHQGLAGIVAADQGLATGPTNRLPGLRRGRHQRSRLPDHDHPDNEATQYKTDFTAAEPDRRPRRPHPYQQGQLWPRPGPRGRPLSQRSAVQINDEAR